MVFPFNKPQEQPQDNSEAQTPRDKNLTTGELEQIFKIGKADFQKYVIESIYALNPDYVVYRGHLINNKKKLWVRYFINDDFTPPEERILGKSLKDIQADLAKIKSIKEGLPHNETIDSLTARAVIAALEGNNEAAKIIIETAFSQLSNLKLIDSRNKYIEGSLYTSIVIIVVCLIARALFVNYPEIPSLNYISYYLSISCYGTLGGFLSIASSLRTLDIDPSSTLRVVGGSRILLAVISSLTLFFAIRAQIAFTSFVFDSSGTTGSTGIWATRFLLVAAGFSERLVPNLIPQVTSNSQTKTLKGNIKNSTRVNPNTVDSKENQDKGEEEDKEKDIHR